MLRLSSLFLPLLILIPLSLTAQNPWQIGHYTAPDRPPGLDASIKLPPYDRLSDLSLYEQAYTMARHSQAAEALKDSPLPQAYLQAGLPVDTLGLRQSLAFYSAPFDTGRPVALAGILSWVNLVQEVQTYKRTYVTEELYPWMQQCAPQIPEEVSAFWDDPAWVPADTLLLCAQLNQVGGSLRDLMGKNLPQAYYEAGLIDLYVLEKLQEVGDYLEGNLARIPPLQSLIVVDSLSSLIHRQQIEKAKLLERYAYERIQACGPNYPAEADSFLARPEYVLSMATLSCLQSRADTQALDIFLPMLELGDLSLERDENKELEEFGPEPEPLPSLPPPGSVAPAVLAPRSMLAGLSPTTMLVDAAAQFLVDRTREELIVAFFERFETRMAELPELRYLFPQTWLQLSQRTYLYGPGLGTGWREAMATDLQHLPWQVEAMIDELPAYRGLRTRSDYRLFQLAFLLTDWLGEGDQDFFFLLMNQLPELAGGPSSTSFLDTALQLNRSSLWQLRTPTSWREAADWEALGPEGQGYFVALQYRQQAALFEQTPTGDGRSLAFHMKEKPQAFLAQERDMVHLYNLASRRVQDFQTALQGAEKDVSRALILGMEALRLGIHAAYAWRHPNDPQAVLQDPGYLHMTQLLSAATQLLVAQQREDPKQLALASLQQLPLLIGMAQATAQRRLEQLEARRALPYLNAQIRRELDDQITRTRARLDGMEQAAQLVGFYGTFILELYHARSEAQMKTILEQYALPSGSYRLKRSHVWSLEVAAFPGLFAGGERLLADSLDRGPALVSGVTAPIGLSVSRGRQGKARDLPPGASGHAVSLFLPILDIGAPFSYRWAQGSTEGLPENISWRQILAPGAYLVWAVKGMPIGLMAGGQFVPQLRSISSSGNELGPVNAIRLSIQATVDIPVLTLWRK
ncbi:MAG: hypothetical protein D6722_10995 [Bacteroidetes bacterium]|nr:MAG: hypothetical protein D6722_10995 [Bacteroidota bacterium]